METRNGDSSALDNLLRRNQLCEGFEDNLKSQGKKGYLERYAQLVMDNTNKQEAAQKARQAEENDILKVSPSLYDELFNSDINERLDAIKVKYDAIDESLKESREMLEQSKKYIQEYYSREQVMVHIANGWGYIGLDPETQEFSDPKFTIDDCDSYCFDDDSGIPVGAKRSGLTEDDIDVLSDKGEILEMPPKVIEQKPEDHQLRWEREQEAREEELWERRNKPHDE